MAYVTRGYILESDIGEGPLFPNDKAPVGLDFNQLVRVANEAKQQHLRLAETYLSYSPLHSRLDLHSLLPTLVLALALIPTVNDEYLSSLSQSLFSLLTPLLLFLLCSLLASNDPSTLVG